MITRIWALLFSSLNLILTVKHSCSVMPARRTRTWKSRHFRNLFTLNCDIDQAAKTINLLSFSSTVNLTIFKNVRYFEVNFTRYSAMNTLSRERNEMNWFSIIQLSNQTSSSSDLSCHFCTSAARFSFFFTLIVRYKLFKLEEKNVCLSLWYICMLNQLSISFFLFLLKSVSLRFLSSLWINWETSLKWIVLYLRSCAQIIEMLIVIILIEKICSSITIDFLSSSRYIMVLISCYSWILFNTQKSTMSTFSFLMNLPVNSFENRSEFKRCKSKQNMSNNFL